MRPKLATSGFLLDGDMLWIRLSVNHALPFPALGAVSADVRVGQFLWTSKASYRAIDHKKIKADANVGVRYWHLGQKLSFNPSLLGFNFNGSQDWADISVGGHVQLPAGKKTVIDDAGDVGGWNATAKQRFWFRSANRRFLQVAKARRLKRLRMARPTRFCSSMSPTIGPSSGRSPTIGYSIRNTPRTV